MNNLKRLSDAYRFPGFAPRINLKGLFGDPRSRIISLQRRGKKQFAVHAKGFLGVFMTGKPDWCEINPVEIFASTWRWKSAGLTAKVAAK